MLTQWTKKWNLQTKYWVTTFLQTLVKGTIHEWSVHDCEKKCSMDMDVRPYTCPRLTSLGKHTSTYFIQYPRTYSSLPRQTHTYIAKSLSTPDEDITLSVCQNCCFVTVHCLSLIIYSWIPGSAFSSFFLLCQFHQQSLKWHCKSAVYFFIVSCCFSVLF